MQTYTRAIICLLAVAFAPGAPVEAAQRSARKQAAADVALERRVRAHVGFLAADAMRGRGSGTEHERIAAEYIGSQFHAVGLEPGAETEDRDRTYVQRVPTERLRYTTAPTLKVAAAGYSREWTYGRDFTSQFQTAHAVSGPLAGAGETRKGAWSLLEADAERDRAFAAYEAGAAGVLMRAPAGRPLTQPGREPAPPRLSARLKGAGGEEGRFAVILISAEVAAEIEKAPAGATITFGGEVAAEEGATWNAVGVLPGSDPVLSKEVILLSAHLDHLGERPASAGGDTIYNGADDDASGCAAVLELARALASGPRPRRTVYFVCFGSEESGGLGSEYFVDKAPVPLARIAANVNFEMLGRPDPKVGPGQLWMTAFDRSNLGPALVRRGAKLVADPHPEENFFTRSDNYTLALKGVVAQSISSFGLHSDYHRPGDEASKIDVAHLARAIGSLSGPIRWLASARFRPAWAPGKAPTKRE